MVVVVMVAEKPSIASSLAALLCPSSAQRQKRPGKCPQSPVHEFAGTFRGARVTFRITSVLGHVFSIDFPPQYQSWDQVDPLDLFDAETLKNEANAKVRMCSHLKHEAKGADYLVLWLDCDREGENICFEVMEVMLPKMNRVRDQQVYRAKFSALTTSDVRRAMQTLGAPNELEARSVDARQELDLKVGVAFTRFQTRYFQGKYGNLDARIVSYGPCQTPTLGFCVARHDEIQQFSPEPFWSIAVKVQRNGVPVDLTWARKRVFDHNTAILFHEMIKDVSKAELLSCENKEGRKSKPKPLNTVELMKIGSQNLGMGPHHVMQIAERLYIAGYISYPRTESSKYPDSFDYMTPLQAQRSQPAWGEYVSKLIADGPKPSKGGVDAGDHPPITPMRVAYEDDLGGDSWRLYDYITRHFIATLSPGCRFIKTSARFRVGAERFKCTGKRVVSPGFTAIMPWMLVEDQPMPDMSIAGDWLVSECSVTQGKTSPPDYLSESELISLMEKNGIGTDASISVHINNICERNYVAVQGGTRVLVPTEVGIALVHGYHRIDPDLVLPAVRSNIEKYIAYIAQGRSTFDEVVAHSLRVFKEKFMYFVRKMTRMDQLFEASFSTLTETTGKFRSKCGKCNRYMKFIHLKPARMYCPTCDDVYPLPQNCAVKLYGERTCPLDNFELVLVQFGQGGSGKSYPVCPHCFNYPALEGMATGKGCNECTHPTCEHSLARNGVGECQECEDGVLVINPISAPKWHMDCNKCNFMVYLPEGAHKIRCSKNSCERCGCTLLIVDFNKKTTPLADGETHYKACVLCDDLLNSLTSIGHSKRRHPMFSRGRGKRRGRGGKRRGRGGKR
eukprot:TRINITY_DN2668_c0_g3_i1.p1 TRINITY_DN2668_c0_g3~~TRINITY_DN2668_c0_g3_i1.p1  ORF type:complete len:846 (+),score=211.68 TRINITY_DN2668_c0_g3_i1:225-2762(+)